MERTARCLMCGREFTARRSTARFCGATCRSAWNRMHVGPRAPRPTPAPAAQTPGEGEVAELVKRAGGIVAGFSAAAAGGVPALRPMCQRLADGIGAALDAEGL